MSAPPDISSQPDSSEPETPQFAETSSSVHYENPQNCSHVGCRCFCSCSGCICNFNNDHHAPDAQSAFLANLNLEPSSLASDFSELTFGESLDSGAGFDPNLLPSQQENEPARQTDSLDVEMAENDDIDLEAVNDNPHAYFLDRRRSGDNNAIYDEEVLIFGELNLDGSMIVNLSEEDEAMMLSYASALGPSSGSSSAMIKDVGAIFDSDQLSDSKRATIDTYGQSVKTF